MSFSKEDNKKLKILFLPAWYPSEDDPVNGIFVKEHAKAASLYNDIVVLYAYLDPLPQFKRFYSISEEFEDGIRTIRVKYGGMLTYLERLLSRTPKQNITSQSDFQEGSPTLFYKALRIPGRIIRDFLWYGVIYSTFRKLLKEGWRPDLIHAHIFAGGVPAVILGKIYKIPVVITEHWSGFLLRQLNGSLKIAARFAMNKADMILPVSKTLEEAIKTYGVKNRFRVVPNVVNNKIFFPSLKQTKNNKKRILLVTSFRGIKGISYLFQALSQLKKKRQDFILDIIGDGPNRSEYEELAGKLELDRIVKFYGPKPKKDVVEFMKKSDFFVLPSIFETFSIVCVEAMACGKPIIATNLPVFREKINKDVGILVPPKNVNGLAGAINYMLDHYQEYSSAKIFQYTRNKFSYEAVGKTLTQIYQETIKEFKKS